MNKGFDKLFSQYLAGKVNIKKVEVVTERKFNKSSDGLVA